MSADYRPRVALETLGCKLNQAETELFAEQLSAAGCEIVPSVAAADIYILNTCSVTHIADRKSRHLLRLARRRNPQVFIVAAGCYARHAAAEAKKLGADLVIGNEEKPGLAALLADSGLLAGALPPLDISPALRTRACIKIQDGCSHFCAYCIVPLLRGRETSLPAGEVLGSIKRREARGCREVVLTGVRVGAYSHDGLDLKGLLERVLSETSIPRVRLSSLQPREVSRPLIELWRSERLCPHFHLSLQSGSAEILARMRRRYTLAEYERALELIRSVAPEAAVTTDVIVGFPGETDAEFACSLEFCRRMDFARIHVFPYSAREGTLAAGLPGKVDAGVKRERSRHMLVLAEECAAAFRRRFAGREMLVLWENRSPDGVWTGLTGNYIKVHTRSRDDLTNRLLPATVA